MSEKASAEAGVGGFCPSVDISLLPFLNFRPFLPFRSFPPSPVSFPFCFSFSFSFLFRLLLLLLLLLLLPLLLLVVVFVGPILDFVSCGLFTSEGMRR